MLKRCAMMSLILIPLIVFGICGYLLSAAGQFGSATSSLPAITPKMPVEFEFQNSGWNNGVAVPSVADLKIWHDETGESPGIVQIYIGFDRSFPEKNVRTIMSAGALPLIQVNPWHISMKKLAQGAYDEHLLQWNSEINKMGAPVALSFGHEMNGPWFPWGCGHVSRRDFIAAWRHMHKVMSSRLIRWVYTANRTTHQLKCGPMQDYPGSSYVTWVGIDGYLRHSSDTFSSVFAKTLRVVHRVAAGKPILLTEAGVPSSLNQAKKIPVLYAGAHQTPGMIGVIYFDNKTRKGDYRPQDDPVALRAFREVIGTTPS